MPTHTCKKCGRITAWKDGEINMQTKCGKCGHNHQTEQAEASSLSDLLCCQTVEACAKLLDKEVERLEQIWVDFMRSGKGGPATDYSAVYRSAAAIVRKAT